MCTSAVDGECEVYKRYGLKRFVSLRYVDGSGAGGGVEIYLSQYNDADHPHGVRTLWQLVVKRITMRGFLTYDHADRLAEAQADLIDWVERGELRALETLYTGLERAPEALIAMLGGATTGKTLVTLDARGSSS